MIHSLYTSLNACLPLLLCSILPFSYLRFITRTHTHTRWLTRTPTFIVFFLFSLHTSFVLITIRRFFSTILFGPLSLCSFFCVPLCLSVQLFYRLFLPFVSIINKKESSILAQVHCTMYSYIRIKKLYIKCFLPVFVTVKIFNRH